LLVVLAVEVLEEIQMQVVDKMVELILEAAEVLMEI
jgi:hypothetical protein